MIEQYYAVNKKTGEVFKSNAQNYTFNSVKGIKSAINNTYGEWGIVSNKLVLVTSYLHNWEIKKVVLE